MDTVVYLTQRLALSPSVALRKEPFGALAYHFGNRRLTFLKRPELVDVVRRLDGSRQLRDVLAECAIPESHWPAYLATVGRLVGLEMLHVTSEDAHV